MTKSEEIFNNEKPDVWNENTVNVCVNNTKESKINPDAVNEKREKYRDGRNSFLKKIIIRRLPPTMTLETFLEETSPLPEYDYLYFVKADLSLGPYSFSRAYINFMNEYDVYVFTEKFDNYIFLDEKGNEYPAIVEYAPFQKVPKLKNKKRDVKIGLINQDSDYQKFIESLQNPEEIQILSAETFLEEIEAKEKGVKANNGCIKISTPLIEYIKQKKVEKQRIKEERRERRKKIEIEKKRVKDEEKQRRNSCKEKEIEKYKKIIQEDKYESKCCGDNNQESSDPIKLGKNEENGLEFIDAGDIAEYKDFDKKSIESRIGLRNFKTKKKYELVSKVEKRRPKFLEESKKNLNDLQHENVNRIQNVSHGECMSSVNSINPGENIKCAIYSQSDDIDQRFSTVKDYNSRKDPRLERRIKNKDRPSLEIYRPGMRKQRLGNTLENEKSACQNEQNECSCNQSIETFENEH